MKQIWQYWTLIREVTLCLVATILFPVLMFSQGFYWKVHPADHEKNRRD